MPNRWSADQVLALAQDPSSRQAAARLAGGAYLSGTGTAGDVVWGLCAGSGQQPYRTVADLMGPAYTCTCPSRKLPCKHALALMLSWAEGAVPPAPGLPDFAMSWMAARAAGAAAPAASTAPRDEKAAARRVQQRQARVAAGLAELETWLRDQVRGGLAGSGGYRQHEQIAARMVDAQAPGVAATLRALGGIAGSGEKWPARLLGAYAQLHLLIEAHGQLDRLPGALAAVVRSHVGYPVARQDVLAGPPVSDRWLVLSTRDVLDGSVPARRVTLRGERTGRFALLLIFDPRGSFDGDHDAALRPGTALGADVHFYPGQPALRALIGRRDAGPDSLGPLEGAASGAPPGGAEPARAVAAGRPDAAGWGAEPARAVAAGRPDARGGIAGMLDDWAAALGQDPWLTSWPALLSGTPVPAAREWRFADHAGLVVPLLTAGTEPWSLLAISGGAPVTVAGEWSTDGLRPLTAWHGDRAVRL